MNREELYKEMEKHKSEMTASERIKAYLNGDRVDHLPYDILCIDWIVAAEMGYSLKDLSNIDIMAKVVNKRFDLYGIDGFGEAMVLRNVGEAVGSKVIYPDNEIDYIEKFAMDTNLDMNLIEKVDSLNNPITKKKLERARILKDRLNDHPIGTEVSGPLTVAAAIRPINKLLRDLKKNPEEVKKLLEFTVQTNLDWVRAFTNEFGPTAVMIADPVGCDDILSPGQIAEFSYPYLDRLASSIYEITGIKAGLHVCGHTKKQWESYKKLDIALYSLDDCEDLADIKDVIEDDLILEGNVDPVEIMRYGSIDDVIGAVKECILKAADSKKGYVVATGCDIPLGTPIENVDAFIYAVRKYSKDAMIGQIPAAVYED